MNWEAIFSIVSLLGIGSIIGAYISNFLERQRIFEFKARERKERQYKKFLENLIGFFEGWESNERKKNFMEELYVHAPLYASSKVIKLSNEFLKSFSREDLKHRGKSDIFYRRLVLAIRDDLKIIGKDKEKLSENDVNILKLNEVNFYIPLKKIKEDILENKVIFNKRSLINFRAIEEQVLQHIHKKIGGTIKRQIHFVYGVPPNSQFAYTPDATIQKDKQLIFIEIKYIAKPKYVDRILNKTVEQLNYVVNQFKSATGENIIAKLVLTSDFFIDFKKYKTPENIELVYFQLQDNPFNI